MAGGHRAIIFGFLPQNFEDEGWRWPWHSVWRGLTPADRKVPSASLPPNIVMLQMLSGFQVSQALYVAAKLDIARTLPATILSRQA
jgi:hypothetical protein